MSKALFTVKRPWFGVVKGDTVELEVTEEGNLLNPVLEANVEPAPEGATLKEAPRLPAVKKQ